MKKKVLFLSLLSITLFYSCNKQSQPAEQTADVSAPETEVLQEEEISKISSFISEVSSCLDSIQIQEKMIFDNKEGVTDKAKILLQLRTFKDLLARKQARINALTAENSSLSSSKKTIQDLQKMVDFINAQLVEKEKQIESLETLVQKKDAKIDELRYGLHELSKESEYLKEQNYQQDRELNAVYYVVGTKKELKAMGLLKSSFSKKVLQENINKDSFKKADKRGLKTIPVASKKASVLTNNPKSSYTITAKEDGTWVLEITDSEKFWSVSPYLIIQQ
ncbi:MAG: hypothetical protein J6W52_05720 [Bacteroidaceae bacterium]|nr:hypothetical protein [Bacteroidaceae bacterium]